MASDKLSRDQGPGSREATRHSDRLERTSPAALRSACSSPQKAASFLIGLQKKNCSIIRCCCCCCCCCCQDSERVGRRAFPRALMPCSPATPPTLEPTSRLLARSLLTCDSAMSARSSASSSSCCSLRNFPSCLTHRCTATDGRGTNITLRLLEVLQTDGVLPVLLGLNQSEHRQRNTDEARAEG